MTAEVPAPRHPTAPYTIAMVCLGNICRSPTAEVVLSAKLAKTGLGSQVTVLSSGTGDWHAGGPMDPRAATTLTAAGYDPSRHRAQQFNAEWFERCDLVLAMDRGNLRAIDALSPDDLARDRVRLFREFDPLADGELEVADPWYGGVAGFRDMLAIVERTTDELVARLQLLYHGDPAQRKR